MSTTPVRVPGLIVTSPLCSLCGNSTHCDGEVFECHDCGYTWSIDDPEAHGVQSDPNQPVCGNTRQPYLDADGTGPVYRCVLPADHHGPLCIGVNTADASSETFWTSNALRGEQP